MRAWSGTPAPVLNDDGRVEMLDLIVHLGRNLRFGGAGSTEWTGLHHSVLVAFIWAQLGNPADGVLHALLHDAHEAYTGDLVGPLKAFIRNNCASDPVKRLEQALDGEIRKLFALQPPSPETIARIKFCDRIALVVEARLFGSPGQRCEDDMPEDVRESVALAVRHCFPLLNEIEERLGRWQPTEAVLNA